MEDNNKSLVAKDWILKLANGINPLDGSSVREDDVINNVHISRCLFYVADLIDSNLIKRSRKGKEYDLPFNISAADLDKVSITERTRISDFTKEINKLIPSNMKPLQHGKILNWLVANGYMEDIAKEDGGKTRRPTNTGLSIGISTTTIEGTRGPYTIVEYNAEAQRFILNNIYAIIGE